MNKLKTIFTCDTATKRLSASGYDSIKRVIEREGYKVQLGMQMQGASGSPCIEVTGDIDAVLFCSKIARSYGQKTMLIINDHAVNVYNLYSQEMVLSGLWSVGRKTPEGNYYFFDGWYYQNTNPLPVPNVRVWN